jgi:hypothetical protein
MKSLEKWTRPDSYMGAEWPEYFVFLGQHRDSDSLSRSNFICGLEKIGGESDTVHIVHESHWAVGWVEWIAIHESDSQALEKANEIMRRLDGYPVVNEDHWSELEWNEACEYWERLSVRDRAEYCQRAGLSIFAARRDYMPSDDSGMLMELLRG